ncbi:hypothetical protein DICVIV_09247 [Dictyocaulus viviparus]|uniref:Uncharacterized protein n=1 Tax=Dictyocaulus viviparus TaxID=29172 RepID=A0A0D8XJJ4_DICVI|nr:hypothetical protein DICVIV_09247 [Dictyocaulus viviparus]
MNMVIYGCSQDDGYGNCLPDEELVIIMSNSRHPQTLQLFKSAKLIEDAACIDILQFRTLDTYKILENLLREYLAGCGDEVVDEDQKLVHSRMDDNNEFVDVECRVENQKTSITNISRQNTCFKTILTQSFHNESHLRMISNYTRLDGNEINIDWSGTIIWENGDEYITMYCLVVGEDGACDSWSLSIYQRIRSISKKSEKDQAAFHVLYYSFLMLFHAYDLSKKTMVLSQSQKLKPLRDSNSHEHRKNGPSQECSTACTAEVLSVFDGSLLVYVWSDEDHMDQPTVHEIYRQLQAYCIDPTDLIFLSTFHECSDQQVSSYGSDFCGVLEGWSPLNGAMLQGVWYFAADLNEDPKIFLQSAVIKLTPNETKSRHFSHNDLSMMLPYLEKVCIEKDSLRWFDLHSQCGSEMSASTRLRRDLITLSHYDVLHILTNVQEPKCFVSDAKGVRADLGAVERAGTWFLMARFDEMALDTYAMVMRLTAVSNTTAVLRLFQSAALPGEPLDCFTRVFTVKELQNGTDYFYELHFESSTKNSTTKFHIQLEQATEFVVTIKTSSQTVDMHAMSI